MAEGHTIAQRTLLEKDLLTISRHIGLGWENLAHYLGISNATIHQIKLDLPSQTQNQICMMLDRWQNTNTATVASLFDKMHEAEECVSVDWIELDKKFCNELQPHQGFLRDALGQSKIWLEPTKLLNNPHARDVLPICMVNRIKEYNSEFEKIHEIIQYIYTKGATVYSKFKECLVKCGQDHFADYLIKLEHGTGVDADCNPRQRIQVYDDRHTDDMARLKKLLRKDLIDEYRMTCNKLQISPLFDGCTADLKEFYITPTLTCLELIGDVQENSSKSVKSYHEIFVKNSDKCQHIYISSEAGCGKTSLVKWMALNWCHAHDPIESDDIWFKNNSDIDELKLFTFMFIIYLRDAPKDLCQIDIMIQEKLLVNLVHSKTYSKYGLEFLQSLLSSERCLIVMDGLDEWRHPQSNDCEKTNKQVPHSKAWPSCTILTTTRPWKLDIAKLTAEDGDKIDDTLKLFGLEENLVSDLIDRVVNRLNELLRKEKKAVEFKDLLRDKKLKAFHKIPIVVMQLLALWFDDEPLGMSWCEIFCNMVEFLFKLFYKKKRMTVDGTFFVDRPAPAYLWNNVHCKAHMELLTELGALAFYMLLGDNQESSLVFHEVVNEKFISDKNVKMACDVGILTQDNRISKFSQGSSSYIYFLHKTLQEFLAALYVWEQMRARNLSAVLVRTKIENFCHSVEKILEMSQMFMFLCGLCPEIMSQLSEHLKQVVSADIRTQNYRSSCDLHPGSSEGRLLGKLQYTMMNCSQEGLMNNHMQVIVPVCDLFIVNPVYGRHFPSWFRWSDKLKSMVANISISSLSVHCVKKAKVLEEILKSLTKFISVQKLWLSQVPGTFVVDILSQHKICSNMTSATHLECVVLKQVNLSYENLYTIVGHVLQLPTPVKVRLWNCSMSGNCRAYIRFHPRLIVDQCSGFDDCSMDILFHTSTASVSPLHRNAESCRRLLQNC